MKFSNSGIGKNTYQASKPNHKKRYVGIGTNHAYVNTSQHAYNGKHNRGKGERLGLNLVNDEDPPLQTPRARWET